MITSLEQGFTILRYQSDEQAAALKHKVIKPCIQFHFCLKGKCTLSYNDNSYSLTLPEQLSYLLYNPSMALPIDIQLAAHTWYIAVLIDLKKLHELFGAHTEVIDFLNDENKNKKYYTESTISPAMSIVLHQLMNYNLSNSIRELYFTGKTYELLSLYFNKPDDIDTEACPFLRDETVLHKIKLAKEFVTREMIEPPSLQEIATEVGLPLKKLKEGFKELYGHTVHGYALDLKLEKSRELLESRRHNVNEIALQMGYSTSSHFINAFKKKFGITPKRYLGS